MLNPLIQNGMNALPGATQRSANSLFGEVIEKRKKAAQMAAPERQTTMSPAQAAVGAILSFLGGQPAQQGFLSAFENRQDQEFQNQMRRFEQERQGILTEAEGAENRQKRADALFELLTKQRQFDESNELKRALADQKAQNDLLLGLARTGGPAGRAPLFGAVGADPNATVPMTPQELLQQANAGLAGGRARRIELENPFIPGKMQLGNEGLKLANEDKQSVIKRRDTLLPGEKAMQEANIADKQDQTLDRQTTRPARLAKIENEAKKIVTAMGVDIQRARNLAAITEFMPEKMRLGFLEAEARIERYKNGANTAKNPTERMKFLDKIRADKVRQSRELMGESARIASALGKKGLDPTTTAMFQQKLVELRKRSDAYDAEALSLEKEIRKLMDGALPGVAGTPGTPTTPEEAAKVLGEMAPGSWLDVRGKLDKKDAPKADIKALRDKAQKAIAQGADKKLVAARFKKLTGQEL